MEQWKQINGSCPPPLRIAREQRGKENAGARTGQKPSQELVTKCECKRASKSSATFNRKPHRETSKLRVTELNLSMSAAKRENRICAYSFISSELLPLFAQSSVRCLVCRRSHQQTHTQGNANAERTRWHWLIPAVLPFSTPPPPSRSISSARATFKHFAEMLRAADEDGGKHHSLLLPLKSVLFLMASHQRIIAPLREREDWEVLTENYRAAKKTKTQQLICGWIKSELWLRWLLVVSTFCSSSRQCFHFVKHTTPSFIQVQAPATFIQDKQLIRQDLYVCCHRKMCVAAIEALLPFRLLE